jgi:phage FluMu protein Com
VKATFAIRCAKCGKLWIEVPIPEQGGFACLKLDRLGKVGHFHVTCPNRCGTEACCYYPQYESIEVISDEERAKLPPGSLAIHTPPEVQ